MNKEQVLEFMKWMHTHRKAGQSPEDNDISNLITLKNYLESKDKEKYRNDLVKKAFDEPDSPMV